MANQAAEDDHAWLEFADAHSGSPFLEEKALYALDPALIDAILANKPRAFTREEEKFERDLAAGRRAGFFCRQAFRYPPLASQVIPSPDNPEVQRLVRSLEEMWMELGVEAGQARRAFAFNHRLLQNVERQRAAFAAWLVTNVKFRKQAADLWGKKWEDHLLARGGFPLSAYEDPALEPLSSPLPEDLDRFTDQKFRVQHAHFCQYWGVERMVTPDLPLPMSYVLLSQQSEVTAERRHAGFGVIVPWYMLRDPQPTLNDLAESDLFAAAIDRTHLREWLTSNRKWGVKRLALMLRLYVTIELALERRYPDRFRREFLDKTFASIDRPKAKAKTLSSVDTIKKIRLEMQKRLKPRSATPDE